MIDEIETTTDPAAIQIARDLLEAMHPGAVTDVNRSHFLENRVTVTARGAR